MTVKKFLIIGQAKGEKWKHGPFYASKLWDWFATIGLTRDDAYKLFEFDALIDSGTARAKKGRVPPSGEQMKLYRPTLVANTNRLNPTLVVPVGNLAVRAVLDAPILLDDAVGQRFVCKPFGACKNEAAIIPLPHPSGVSLWLNSAANKKLLAQALAMINEEIR